MISWKTKKKQVFKLIKTVNTVISTIITWVQTLTLLRKVLVGNQYKLTMICYRIKFPFFHLHRFFFKSNFWLLKVSCFSMFRFSCILVFILKWTCVQITYWLNGKTCFAYNKYNLRMAMSKDGMEKNHLTNQYQTWSTKSQIKHNFYKQIRQLLSINQKRLSEKIGILYINQKNVTEIVI